MTKGFFRFLEDEGIADTNLINSLCVTSFVRKNHWNVDHCSSIDSLLLPLQTPLLVKTQKELDGDGCTYQLEELIALFEYVVSPADKVVTGAVYTPEKVRKTILQRLLGNKSIDELRRLRVADISCGCGGFLMDVALFIHRKTGKPFADIFRDNIYGIDVQEYSVERTKILLCLLALSEGEDADFEFNLLCRDTLDFVCNDWDNQYTGFDVVVGNPPYVCSRNLTEETHVKLKKYDVCATGHPDLYIPFFKIAIDMLNNNGQMGYITMNTFIRSVNGRAIRQFFSQNNMAISIVDFRGHQIFGSKNTYTCLFFLDKLHKAEGVNYIVDDQGVLSKDVQYKFIPYAELNNEKGWALNDFEATAAIESVGVQIKDYCPSRHGIATLSNDTFIFNPVVEDERYLYLDRKGKLFPIEKGICRDIVNPNKLNSNNDIVALEEKVIFPYRIEGKRAYIYGPAEMKKRFPMALEYLQSCKDVLLQRDKGDTSAYSQWYAYGRTQSLVMPRFKLFFPKFANKPLRCAICDDPKLMLYNGLAFVNEDKRKLLILKAVIESDIFWNYIRLNGKPYASGYYSLSGVDIKHFGIPKFTEAEENELLTLNDRTKIEKWLKCHYN